MELWDGQQERGSENALWDKNKPGVRRRNWPDASLGEASVLHLLSLLGASGLWVGLVSLHTTHGMQERNAGEVDGENQ